MHIVWIGFCLIWKYVEYVVSSHSLESITSLFTSINITGEKNTAIATHSLAVEREYIAIGLIKECKKMESNIEWMVLTTEIISTCPASCQNCTTRILTRSTYVREPNGRKQRINPSARGRQKEKKRNEKNQITHVLMRALTQTMTRKTPFDRAFIAYALC